MSELADLWSGRLERERRKASGTAEFPREVPDRVIDAPTALQTTYDYVSTDDARRGEARAEQVLAGPNSAFSLRDTLSTMYAIQYHLEAKIARLEAEKQDAHGEYLQAHCTQCDQPSPSTAAKQGDAS